MRKVTDQRHAQTMSLLWTSFLLLGDVILFWCHEVACGVRWSNVVGYEVMWGDLLWLVATWYVVSCHVIWRGGHVIWCDVSACCVISRDAMRRHGDELLSVVPCSGMECYELKIPLVARPRCVGSKWFCDGVVIQRTFLYYKELLCLYYKVLLQFYSVLQSTTAVLLCTTKYRSSTTEHYKVLLQYYSALQSATKYYSSTFLFYKVLLQYYSVLQSTSSTTLYYKVLQSTTKWYSVLRSIIPILLCSSKYYKVSLQCFSVLQSTTPVLFQYYSSITLYCKVLLRYYSCSVLLQCCKVLPQFYSVLQSTTKYDSVLQSATK